MLFQKVDISVLKSLQSGKKDGIAEAEAGEQFFSYDEFVAEYDAVTQQIKKEQAAGQSADKRLVDECYEQVLSGWLRHHCPPIKFVGQGSSRAAFVCSGGKCLKVATNIKGISQNKQEEKSIGTQSKWKCFPRMYGYDTKHHGSIVVDCCTEMGDGNVESTAVQALGGYGVSAFGCLQRWIKILRLVVNECRCDFAAAHEMVYEDIKYEKRMIQKEETDSARFRERRRRLNVHMEELDMLEDLQFKKSAVGESLNDLVAFYKANGGNDEILILDDLEQLENWGLAVAEDGALKPVIIDAGLSNEVYDEHYSWRL